MPTHATINIFSLIIEKLRNGNTASLKEFSAHLSEHDFPKSERSILRYIEQLRKEFGLEIEYNISEKAYELKETNGFELERFLNLLQLTQSAGLPIQNKKSLAEISEFLLLENLISFQGIQYLKDILKAIQNRNSIQFLHFNFHTELSTQYKIKPILLKQYLNRWYVIGDIGKNEYRTFGLDRISDIVIDKKVFPKQNTSDIKKKFEQIIGLNYSVSEPIKVRLELSSLQAKYLKAAPLHESQYLELETIDTVVFVLHVIPNYELIQRILMMADQVKVLEPHSLKKEVHQLLKSTLALYK
jgi:predicted DNA-binding transcriptional regulator YafY